MTYDMMTMITTTPTHVTINAIVIVTVFDSAVGSGTSPEHVQVVAVGSELEAIDKIIPYTCMMTTESDDNLCQTLIVLSIWNYR